VPAPRDLDSLRCCCQNHGMTPPEKALIESARLGDIDGVKAALAADVDIHAMDVHAKNNSALRCVVIGHHDTTVRLVLAACADPAVGTERGVDGLARGLFRGEGISWRRHDRSMTGTSSQAPELQPAVDWTAMVRIGPLTWNQRAPLCSCARNHKVAATAKHILSASLPLVSVGPFGVRRQDVRHRSADGSSGLVRPFGRPSKQVGWPASLTTATAH